MTFCKYCGTALNDDAQFCPACGKGNLPGDARQTAPVSIPQENIQAPSLDRDYLKVPPVVSAKKTVLIAILAVLLALSLGANVFFAYKFFGDKGAETESTTLSEKEKADDSKEEKEQKNQKEEKEAVQSTDRANPPA